MSNSPPVTAIVIFRNERVLLEECLSALSWCDELIAVDMDSSDGSRAVAQRFTDKLYRVPVHPIAEPTRVAAAKLASHNWILLIDPDEIIPAQLASAIRQTLAEHADAGALCLPTRYYFKRKMLTGTVWGFLVYKRQLIHRDRCALLPYCNRITELKEGEHEVRVQVEDTTGDGGVGGQWAGGEWVGGVRHYWSDSYRDLLHKHFRRYAHLEAKAMAAEGKRFSLRRGISFPLGELKRCLKDFDGWRMGVRGFLLTGIYVGYIFVSSWLLLWYQRKSHAQSQQQVQIPMLERIEAKKLEARAA